MSGGVVVVGAGTNGLVAAARLAKRGRRVTVLERRSVAGGLAAGEEFARGYSHAGILHDTAGFRADLVRGLELERHGLELRPGPEPVFAPQRRGGPGLLLAHDPAEAESEIAAHSTEDAVAYRKYRAFLERLRPVGERLFASPPPDPGAADLGSLARIAGSGWALRRLGTDTLLEVLRLGPMAVADWLREWFRTELLGAVLAGPAVYHGFHGPWSPATNALLVRHELMATRAVRGGPAALAVALEKAVAAAGAEVRLGTAVDRIRVRGGRVVGVALAGGEEIDADAVIATCDPKTTFGLLESGAASPGLHRRIDSYRQKGMTAKVHLAVNGPLRFACRPELEVERARTGETFDGIERAFDFAKYRRLSPRPVLDILVPTVADPSRAPEGRHVVSVLAHWAPRDLEAGWTDASRDALGTAILNALGEVAPELPGAVEEIEVLTPADLEERFGLAGGHLLHGDHGLDQLLARPAPECAAHATPVPGLFVGGSGSWPGGGITGAPGALAADRVLASG
jgi:phytoene dehydrogenase-like protein